MTLILIAMIIHFVKVSNSKTRAYNHSTGLPQIFTRASFQWYVHWKGLLHSLFNSAVYRSNTLDHCGSSLWRSRRSRPYYTPSPGSSYRSDILLQLCWWKPAPRMKIAFGHQILTRVQTSGVVSFIIGHIFYVVAFTNSVDFVFSLPVKREHSSRFSLSLSLALSLSPSVC